LIESRKERHCPAEALVKEEAARSNKNDWQAYLKLQITVMLNLDFQKTKKFLIEKEDKIILFIGFVLVAFLSFGAGKLSETYHPQTPIIFKNAPDCPASATTTGTSATNATDTNTQGKIIGNKNSMIYHVPGSASYNKISPENRVYFDTEADAQKAGYRKTKM